MVKLWGRPVVAAVLVSIVALILWPILGGTKALAAYTVGLLILLLHHLSNLSRLYRWLKDPRSDTLPEGGAEWEEVYASLARLLRRQTQIEVRLSAALERFQQAGAALPEGVIILDDADRIEWCNPKAEAYFGLSSQRTAASRLTYPSAHHRFAEHLETRTSASHCCLRLWRNDRS